MFADKSTSLKGGTKKKELEKNVLDGLYALVHAGPFHHVYDNMHINFNEDNK